MWTHATGSGPGRVLIRWPLLPVNLPSYWSLLPIPSLSCSILPLPHHTPSANVPGSAVAPCCAATHKAAPAALLVFWKHMALHTFRRPFVTARKHADRGKGCLASLVQRISGQELAETLLDTMGTSVSSRQYSDNWCQYR